jgi:hypothetical protein
MRQCFFLKMFSQIIPKSEAYPEQKKNTNDKN